MATVALPISQLMPVVSDAKRKTECVVVCSRSENADTATVWNIARKTITLKRQFADLARLQEKRIAQLVERDFSSLSRDDIKEIAAFLEKLVAAERDLLSEVYQLGSEIRFWWNQSLVKLAQQIEHLDSIAESLLVECDDEASVLLGVALDEVATEPAPEHKRLTVAMK